MKVTCYNLKGEVINPSETKVPDDILEKIKLVLGRGRA